MITTHESIASRILSSTWSMQLKRKIMRYTKAKKEKKKEKKKENFPFMCLPLRFFFLWIISFVFLSIITIYHMGKNTGENMFSITVGKRNFFFRISSNYITLCVLKKKKKIIFLTLSIFKHFMSLFSFFFSFFTCFPNFGNFG